MLSKYWRIWILVPFVAVFYTFYVWNLSTNPPGFYLDESAGAYNAYLLATTGQTEYGDIPIIPRYYTGSKTETANPVHLYMLAVMYLVVPPSNLSARVLAASMVFLACLLMGLLAKRLSGRTSIGVIVALIALATPWLFDASRLVLEVFVCPLVIVLFLICLERANRRGEWSMSDQILLGVSLGLITYAYSIGRLLGPMFGLGLLLFVSSWRDLWNVVKTGIVYTFALLPFLYVYFFDNWLVTRRFQSITWLHFDRPWMDLLSDFWNAYSQDIGLEFLLDKGDPLARHHVPGTGGILAGAFALAVIGLVVALTKYRHNRWWWFIIYGLLVSVLPGALTTQRFHFLRMIGVPVFLTVLTIPALMLVLREKSSSASGSASFAEWLERLPERFISAFFERPRGWLSGLFGKTVLAITLLLIFNQAYEFQTQFRSLGPTRGFPFDQAYPAALDAALAREERPIYLEDGMWGPAYVHAYWYSVQKGVDRANYVHLQDNEVPPPGALVLSSHGECRRCEVISRHGSYIVYRATGVDGVVEPSGQAATQPVPPAVVAEKLPKPTVISPDASKPHGIAADAAGNIFITDAGNSRVLKLSPEGYLITAIGQGTLSEPTGVAVDQAGNIIVADGRKEAVFEFQADGALSRQWDTAGRFDELRDVAVGPDKWIYLSDRGRVRIFKLDAQSGSTSDWGGSGADDGQFHTVNGIAVAGGNLYVADAQNDRVQVFDLDGNFLRQWPVTQWANYIWHRPDVAVDEKSKLVYVTSGWTHEVLIYDLEGTFVRTLRPEPPAKFNNPSSIFVSDTKRGKFLYVLNTGTDVVEAGPPSIFVFDLNDPKK